MEINDPLVDAFVLHVLCQHMLAMCNTLNMITVQDHTL